MANIVERLNNLRRVMKEYNVDCVVVPTNDFHSSEYVAGYFKHRAYISGFTGSAGTCVILNDEAGLWTDGRYFLQAEDELKGSTIDLYKMGMEGVPKVTEFILSRKDKIKKVAFDARVMNAFIACDFVEKFNEAGIEVFCDEDLVGKIWDDRPSQVFNEIYDYSVEYAGESRESKLSKVFNHISELGADGLVISSLDDIAWLYNLRGSDVMCNPVFMAYTVLLDGVAYLYVNESSVPTSLKETLSKANVVIKNYYSLYDDLKCLSSKKIVCDSTRVNYYILKCLENCEVVNEMNYTTKLKAIKNSVEIAKAYETHITDAVAVTKFIYKTKKDIKNNPSTELDLCESLLNLRKQGKDFKDISFETIAGYGPHGAIIHYDPTPETNIPVYDKSFLLVDSGGQYLGGTTDITRTIAMGELTDEEKKVYTLVLKAHLALGNAKWEKGECGKALDELTRKVLSDYGYSYNHGTGHGVGSFLNVHEGPQSVSVRSSNAYPFEAGMITSNEPGVYLTDKFGVRIENLTLCVEVGENKLGFDDLTVVPYEVDAIDVSLLNDIEKEQIRKYHNRCYETLKEYLTSEEREWLGNIAKAI